MAEEKGKPKEKIKESKEEVVDVWHPTTLLGQQVKAGQITELRQILDRGLKIMESKIVDTLVPGLECDFILIGQSKGKFGGGKRRIFKQTQKKTREGNKPRFTVVAVVGNRDGYVGLGTGTSRETMPAREKAIRDAKLNIIQVARGCGSWECGCGGEPHSIPFKLYGHRGSVEVTMRPAPRGVGLCVESEMKKVLELAGFKDVWSKVKGHSQHKINTVYACFDALKHSTRMRVDPAYKKIVVGVAGS